MRKFKIDKKQVTRFTLHVECCECDFKDELIVGYDFLTRDQASKWIHDEISGWDVSNREKPLCPECRTKSGRKSRI